jgi:hypothetical protein
VFVTVEGETGCVNVVVWNALVESQRRELLGANSRTEISSSVILLFFDVSFRADLLQPALWSCFNGHGLSIIPHP